ncbi:MAG: tetratricopeptide repeat protein [Candidatus Sericytochromatia bacterium]
MAKEKIDFLEHKFKLALNFEDAQKYDKAEEIYNSILQMRMDDPRATLGRAVARIIQNKMYDGLLDLSKAYLISDVEGKIRSALIYEEIGNAKEAYICFGEIVRDNPDNYNANLNLARLDLFHGKKEDASNRLTNMIEKNPEIAEAYIQLANINLIDKNIDKSIELYEKSLTINPDNIYVLYTLTLAYLEKGDTNLALVHLNRGLELEPENPTLLDIKKEIENS